jgi:hypothetical protein
VAPLFLVQRAGANTTQLLGDSCHKHGNAHSLYPGAFAAGEAADLHPTRRHHGGAGSGPSAGAGAGGGVAEECTTKLLADSTAASACGAMGLVPVAKGVLGGTIAGGAPVVQQEHQRQQKRGPFGSPVARSPVFGAAAAAVEAFGQEPMGFAAAASQARTRSASLSPLLQVSASGAAAPAAASSPAAWHQQHDDKSAAAGAGVNDSQLGNEPTLELAGAAAQGAQTQGALEDATLDDFVVPPDLSGGDERPLTMPFSGRS